ncbi:C1 family peptidase [Mycoplasma phocoeninasale]|uniref:C1 family peptidase n=1 Tax=Mycoplasma phocoeninasale TaxID=2726117 RepID=UPI00196754D6|nr:hypothetical protein [Mycoplasma phocoeninasale]
MFVDKPADYVIKQAIEKRVRENDNVYQIDLGDDKILKLVKFDMRDYGFVTDPEYQKDRTCWGFAVVSAVEGNILKHGFYKNSKTLDLWEYNLIHNSKIRKAEADPLRLTANDITSDYIDWNEGDSPKAVSYSLLQWNSLLDKNGRRNVEDEKFEKYSYSNYILKDIIHVDNNVNDVKKAIYKYGSVVVTLNMTPDSTVKYYNTKEPGQKILHAVNLIGWDDSVVDKEGKKTGAWIAKNSWGTKAHDNGFFHLSYDSDISEIRALDYTTRTESQYDNNYYYDGFNIDIYSKNKIAAASFPVLKDNDKYDEFLRAVNVSFKGKNSEITIKIYKNHSKDIANRANFNPTDGELVATQKQQFENPGSRTIDLKDKIKLEANTVFSVVVEQKSDDPDAGVILSSEEHSTNDLTFVKEGDKWVNPWFNNRGVARIKAFTQSIYNPNKQTNNDIKYLDTNVEPLKILSYQSQEYKNFQNNIRLFDTSNTNQLVEGRDFTKTTEVFFDNSIKTVSDDNIIGYYHVILSGKNKYKGIKDLYFLIKVSLRPPLSNDLEYSNDGNTIKFKNLSPKISKNWKLFGDTLTYVGLDVNFYRRSSFRVENPENANIQWTEAEDTSNSDGKEIHIDPQIKDKKTHDDSTTNINLKPNTNENSNNDQNANGNSKDGAFDKSKEQIKNPGNDSNVNNMQDDSSGQGKKPNTENISSQKADSSSEKSESSDSKTDKNHDIEKRDHIGSKNYIIPFNTRLIYIILGVILAALSVVGLASFLIVRKIKKNKSK